MDFEQMQLIWDEQKERRLFALDMDALHQCVKQRARGVARGVEAMEIGMIAMSVVLAAFLAWEPLFHGTDREQFLSAALLLGVAAYLAVGRLQRRARERRFESNLLGDLERAISRVDYHIRRIRTFPLWFLLPSFLTVLIGFVSASEAKPPWAWLLVLAAFPLGIYVSRLELACTHLPMKRELEALRTKLTDER